MTYAERSCIGQPVLLGGIGHSPCRGTEVTYGYCQREMQFILLSVIYDIFLYFVFFFLSFFLEFLSWDLLLSLHLHLLLYLSHVLHISNFSHSLGLWIFFFFFFFFRWQRCCSR
ncbi:hypothetical protein V8C42DRAFT_309134 [Trichoderma barbatum]